MGYRGTDQFRTDPTGMLSKGAPRGMGGSMLGNLKVGRVGIPVNSAAVPGQTGGTGFGGTISVPMGGTPEVYYDQSNPSEFKKGGKVKAKAKPKKMAKGGSTASKRADGCATKGKTKGRFV